MTDNFSSLEEIDERLFQYKKISRKHGVNEDSLEDLMQELNKELNLYFDLTQISIFDKNSKERI